MSFYKDPTCDHEPQTGVPPSVREEVPGTPEPSGEPVPGEDTLALSISRKQRDGNRIWLQGLSFVPNIGDWNCTNEGVSLNGKVACGVPVLLTRRVVRIDDPYAPEKVMLSFLVGGSWRNLTILPTQYGDPNQLAKLADQGLPVNRRMAGLLSDYLAEFYTRNREQIPVMQAVGRLGWIQLGAEPLFAPYTGGTQLDGECDFAPLFDAVHTAGACSRWVDAARRLRAESEAARLLMAASFASVLVKPLGSLPFFCHVWGPTGCGKTVALRAAASVWAAPNTNFVKNFNGTAVGFERIAHFLNSLPFCIDELQLARKEKGKVVFNPYELAEGQGRTRGTKTGGVESATNWALAVLTTGESPLNAEGAGAGARNRVVEIGWNEPGRPLLTDGAGYLEVFGENYGWAGPEFINRLSEPGMLAKVRRLHARNRAELSGSDVTDKQAEAAALILTADQLACLWLFDPQQWEDPETVQTVPAMIAPDILPWLATNAQVRVGPRAYEYLRGWVARERSRFDPHNSVGPTYGVVEDGWAYIIAEVFNAACRDADFDPDAVRAELKGMGKLWMNGKRNMTVNKRVRGTQVRCVCLKLEDDAFEELPQDEDDPFCYAGT